jgi:hypothetical protein
MTLKVSTSLLLLALLSVCTARAQQPESSATEVAAAPYEWVKLVDSPPWERSIPYSSKPQPEDPNVFEESAVARGTLRSAGRPSIVLATFNGADCHAAWISDDPSRRGNREVVLDEGELLVTAPGYHAEWETMDEQKLRRMSEADLVKMGAVPLEGIMLAGRGGFSGFVARLSSERNGSLAGMYGIIASRPPAGSWRFLEVEKRNGQDGPIQILLIKKGEGEPGLIPGPPR